MITVADVDAALRAAGDLDLPPGHEVIHILRQTFVIDGVPGIKDPVGMAGRRLEAETCVITAASATMHELIRGVRSLKLELDALVLEPLAAGHAVLSLEERGRGVLVIDVGGGTTGTGIFRNGGLIHACTLPVGGEQITSDLSYGLKTGFGGAEELKRLHGSTLDEARDEVVPVSVIGQANETWVNHRAVAEIVDARLAEIFELVGDKIVRDGYGDCYPGGVVITGGTAELPGAVALAAESFGVRARLGTPSRLGGLSDALRGPSFATSVGLLAWGRQRLVEAAAPVPSRSRRTWRSGLVGWIRGFWV